MFWVSRAIVPTERENQMTIKVQLRSVYGNDVIYPACPDARRFADLAGTRTLTVQALKIIRDLGYKIEVVLLTVSIAA